MNDSINMVSAIEAVMQLSMILMVGLYFTFSNTVMASLKGFENGVDVMVELNKVILNPLFMTCFIGSGISSAYLAVTGTGLVAISGAVFFIGTTLVTVIKNVPLNNKLLNATEAISRQQVWREYLQKWVFWNHIRTASAVLSAFLLVV